MWNVLRIYVHINLVEYHQMQFTSMYVETHTGLTALFGMPKLIKLRTLLQET